MIIDGKKIAEGMLAEVKKEVALRRASLGPNSGRMQGEFFRLAAVLVGDHGLSRKFLELKKKAAEKVGIDFRLYEFPTDITTQKLRKEIVGVAKAEVNHGVLVELPLPVHFNAQYVLNAIPQEKDVDVLSEKSQGSFFVGRSVILPPAAEAVKQIFKFYNIEMSGKHCVVFGYGILVGKPI